MSRTKSPYSRSFEHGYDGKYLSVRNLLKPGMKVLELGCADGYFSRALAREGVFLTCIENQEDYLETVVGSNIEVIPGDLDSPALVARIDKKYDAILAMDILEHLKDPLQLLVCLKSKLAVGGKIIVTGPNVAHWSIRMMLLTGKWEYQETGIMDKTHLRWFTKKGWQKLLVEAGYEVTKTIAAERGTFPLQYWVFRPLLGENIANSIATALTRWTPELFGIVFLLEAVPLDEASADDMRGGDQ